MEGLDRRWRVLFASLLLLGIHVACPGVVAFSTFRESSVIGVPTRATRQPFANFSSKLLVAPKGGISETGEGMEDDGGKKTIVAALLAGMSALAIAAKAGVVPGPLDPLSGTFGIYTDTMILRDIASALTATILAYVAVRGIGYGYEQGYYSSKISRKLQHTLLAPAFMATFPIFSPADGARYFAALVTLVNGIRLYLAATGQGESSLARSVSRSGDKSEALGGPFIYVCLLTIFILAFWRSSMIGVVAACTMAAGDGMADLIGRQFGKNHKWWFSEDKSVTGTVAFAISASFASYGLVSWLQYTGCLEVGLTSVDLAIRIVWISVICSIVELLPIGDDNFSVPLSAAALAAFFLQ